MSFACHARSECRPTDVAPDCRNRPWCDIADTLYKNGPPHIGMAAIHFAIVRMANLLSLFPEATASSQNIRLVALIFLCRNAMRIYIASSRSAIR